ncbi:MAG: hypothetical protein P4L39_07640 [Humidesulfovibrio sp.]|nr:hypothetical protein [Humidesulfovibrio sp.]
MTTTPIAALADFLDDKARSVKAIEAEAEAILHGQGDQSGYQALMRKKAELLAELADDAQPLVDALPRPRAGEAEERLGLFSMSAANALRIGSVFYMSALLYPDEHKKGEPNNLELFAAEVRAWA